VHDPEKPVLDLIGDGNQLSDKIMRPAKARAQRCANTSI
jgi:hypothetical protein